jgi:hypothetical protein
MKAGLKHRFLAGAVALAGVLGIPSVASAEVGCARWNVSQGWYAMQGSLSVLFQLRQQNTRIEGSASYRLPPTFDQWILGLDGTSVVGGVDGTVTGNQIELHTNWGGVYVGTIDATGRIDGRTFDKRDSMSNAAWYSDRRMNCGDQADAAAAIKAEVESAKAASQQPNTKPPLQKQTQPPPIPERAAGPLTPRVSTRVTAAHLFEVRCNASYVLRRATPTDRVCVTVASSARVRYENRLNHLRLQPGGGAYGPNTCREGFVWREAQAGDLVCVTPERRAAVRLENQTAAANATLIRRS